MHATRIALAAALSSLVLFAASARADDNDIRTGTSGASLYDATLYEVVENVKFTPVDGIIQRGAVAALMGVVRVGTPLCPAELITNPSTRTCTVTGMGRDNLSLVTGQGPVSGKFSVVVNAPGNSSVHVPDLPVLTGTFSGDIDLSQAVVWGVPVGLVSGSFTVAETGQVLPFLGVFRLPFALDANGNAKEHEDESEKAFYLGDDGRLLEVRGNERSLGFPAVRLDLRFVQ